MNMVKQGEQGGDEHAKEMKNINFYNRSTTLTFMCTLLDARVVVMTWRQRNIGSGTMS